MHVRCFVERRIYLYIYGERNKLTCRLDGYFPILIVYNPPYHAPQAMQKDHQCQISPNSEGDRKQENRPASVEFG